jgi:hypothetical protein
MLAHDLLRRDLGFSDTARLLQQTQSDDDTPTESRGEFYHDMAVYMFGFLIMVVMVSGCFIMCVSPERAAAFVHKKTVKSTLAERKRAILQFFEASQVTMVSTDNTPVSMATHHN